MNQLPSSQAATGHPTRQERAPDGTFRPLLANPQQVQALVKRWRKGLEREKKKPTITGLCIALNCLSHSGLRGYVKRAEEDPTDATARAVQKAYLEVIDAYEQRLHGTTPVGAIFALKAIAGFRDTDAPDSGERVVVQVLNYGTDTGVQAKRQPRRAVRADVTTPPVR